MVASAMVTRSDLTTRLRLASGLVLMTFVASHLTNHALGLHSLEAMEQGRGVFLGVWRSWPDTLLLYGALATHVTLVVHKLYRRRSLKMPAWEIAQIGLGLMIPVWLVVHVVGTRGAHEVLGVRDTYLYELHLLWPGGMVQQSTLVLLAWLHGCIGVHFWLRLRPWYQPARPWLFALALLLPILALIGFVDAARDVAARAAADPEWIRAAAVAEDWLSAAERAWVYRIEDWVLSGFVAVLGVVAAARLVHGVRTRDRVRLRYPDGTTVALAPGMSVLEASRTAGIPHASVCGGHGRCSTCRVRIAAGARCASCRTRGCCRCGPRPGSRHAGRSAPCGSVCSPAA